MKSAHLDALLAAQKTKQPVVLVTHIKSGAQAVVTDNATAGALELGPALRSMIGKARTQDRSMTVEAEGERYFLLVQIPPRRLIDRKSTLNSSHRL